jgi:small-conductance mechanosensitive channel
MTEAFMGYSEDFEQCRDDAMGDIRAIPKARDQAERSDLTERAQGNIAEAERYMRILESESRAGTSQDRRRMHQQLRTFKSQLDKLKANLERSKLMDGSQQRQQASAPQDNVARYQKRTDRIDDHLTDAQDIIARTEATAQNINTNLAGQREQLINVRTNVRRRLVFSRFFRRFYFSELSFFACRWTRREKTQRRRGCISRSSSAR